MRNDEKRADDSGTTADVAALPPAERLASLLQAREHLALAIEERLPDMPHAHVELSIGVAAEMLHAIDSALASASPVSATRCNESVELFNATSAQCCLTQGHEGKHQVAPVSATQEGARPDVGTDLAQK